MQYEISIRTASARWPRDQRGRVSVSFGGLLASVLAGCLATVESPA
jgi:hypothetical protein